MTIALAPRSHRRSRSAAKVASVHTDIDATAALAVDCLRLEIGTWPKPGLVSHVDSGSHADMDADTFRRSIDAISPYLHALVEAGAQGCAMGRLRIIGLEAETAMLAATGGVNTHRGAIFGLGLLCAAAGVRVGGRADPATPLGTIVARLWGAAILNGPVLLHSHGRDVCRRYGTGGARLEAAEGFPSVYEIGLPALRQGALMAPSDAEAARVQACFSLIATLEDTNLLHRGGLSGLRFAQRVARDFLDDGGVGRRGWRERAHAVHRAFVARRLSPGGSADLLAMSLFVHACEALYEDKTDPAATPQTIQWIQAFVQKRSKNGPTSARPAKSRAVLSGSMRLKGGTLKRRDPWFLFLDAIFSRSERPEEPPS